MVGCDFDLCMDCFFTSNPQEVPLLPSSAGCDEVCNEDKPDNEGLKESGEGRDDKES